MKDQIFTLFWLLIVIFLNAQNSHAALTDQMNSGIRSEGVELIARIKNCEERIRAEQAGDSRTESSKELAGYLRLLDPDDDVASGIYDFLSAEDANSFPPETCSSIAYFLLERGEPVKASSIYLELILKFPDHPDVEKYRVALAESFAKAGDESHAKAQLMPLAKSNHPESVWAMLELARISQLQKNQKEALTWYHKVETQLPESKAADIARQESRSIQFNQFLSSRSSTE